MLIFLFLVLSTASLITANAPGCPSGGLSMSPYDTDYGSTSFPNKIKGSYPTFPPNYVCNFTVNVRSGWYATLWITYQSLDTPDENSRVIVTDQSNFSEVLTQANREIFYFIENNGAISISTGGSKANFSVEVVWKWNTAQDPTSSMKINVFSYIQQNAYVFPINEPMKSYQVYANTRISILAMPSENDVLNNALRGTLIFDGVWPNAALMGSAMQLWSSKKQWVTTGTSMTLQFTLLNYNGNNTQLILQDYENTKGIVSYQCGMCKRSAPYGYRDDCQFILDNSLGTSAVMTYERYDTETMRSLDGNGTLDVYLGGYTPDKSNRLISYTANNTGLTLPQNFAASIRTYVLEGVNAKAVMNFTKNFRDVSNYDSVGSKKILMSSYYSQMHIQQYVDYRIMYAEQQQHYSLATFSYRIRFADIAENSSLRITVINNGNNVYDQIFDASNRPSYEKVVIVGDYMDVTLKSSNGYSKGLLMEYEISKAVASKWSSVVFVMFFVIIRIFWN